MHRGGVTARVAADAAVNRLLSFDLPGNHSLVYWLWNDEYNDADADPDESFHFDASDPKTAGTLAGAITVWREVAELI